MKKPEFVLIDNDITPLDAGNDYDALLEKADRHNEDARVNDFYHVIESKDLNVYAEAMRGGR